MSILITGGRVIDPGQEVDRTANLLIDDGVVKGLGVRVTSRGDAQVFDATGLVVCPGFIDLHCHLREPGFEYKETITTGTRAAARGEVPPVARAASRHCDPFVSDASGPPPILGGCEGLGTRP